MNGISATTGRPIDDTAHLRQSIANIITTPIGTRVMRRDYGSLLPELIDQPFNDLTRIRLYAAIAQAIMRWEPRLALRRVEISRGENPGAFVIDLHGVRTDLAGRSDYTRFTLPIRARQGRGVQLAA